MATYEEAPDAGNRHREAFLGQFEAWLDREFREAESERSLCFRPDLSSPESYAASLGPFRERFVAMLGWPLTLPPADLLPAAREEVVAEDALGWIYREWIEVVPGVEAYGILFVPPLAGPRPLVISQHGGLGTPELCSGFFGSANYNDMTRRVLRRGVAVFAPQLFRWAETYGPKPDCVELDRQLKQLGGSLAAFELFCLRRWLDSLTAREHIDGDRVGMIGLSYGGFHTLFAAAADTRIRVAVPSCFFNDRRVYGRGDWSWFGAARRFFDAEVAGLICPRALYIEVAEHDELLRVETARPEARKVEALYARLGILDRFRYKEHPGTHELDKTDDGVDFLIRHLG